MTARLKYIFIVFSLILTACGKNEFSLDFNLQSDITQNYNVTYYATDIEGGKTVQAVASVRDGKCFLKGFTKRPTLVFITTGKSKLPLVVYADRENKIIIQGEDNNPLTWKVEGNKMNESLTQWRENNISIFEDCEADSVNLAVKNYVEENYDNPVSTILMLTYFSRKQDEREYTRLMASLRGSARDKKWLKLAARTDQLYHMYHYPARLESLVMRGTSEEPDTILINRKEPVLFYIWQIGSSEKNEVIDSLKILVKEYPDTSLLIADICADVDSMAWRNAIKRDSIKNIKRFWSPMGLSDPKLMKLKVNSLPYFIVFDNKGVQNYRGTEISEAVKSFRELHSPKP